MTKWEYTTAFIETSERYRMLNDYGSDGWELVFVEPIGLKYLLFFKRPLA